MKSVLGFASSHFAIAMVIPRGGCWVDCCTMYHQDTELSHTYHIYNIALPVALCGDSSQHKHKHTQPLAPLLLFLHVASSPSFHPSCLLFILTSLSLMLHKLHIASFSWVHLLLNSPLFSAPVVSSSSPSSSPVDSCLFFTWEPCSPSLTALRCTVPT